MKWKYILLIIYSFIMLYLGYVLSGIFSPSTSSDTEIISDTLLFEKWNAGNKTAVGKQGGIKPKRIKYQKLDSSSLLRVKENAVILQVRKMNENIDVLSRNDSKILESSFTSKFNNFTIMSNGNEIKYFEDKKYFSYNGFRTALLFKHDFNNGRNRYLAEIGALFSVINDLNLELALNSLPEINLRIIYTLK